MSKRIFILLLALSAGILPAHGDTSERLGPPYQLEDETAFCSEGTFATCTERADFDPANGAIDVALRIAADAPGAGRGAAGASAWFEVEHQLDERVASLAYEVDVRIDQAHVSVDGLYANTVAFPSKGFAFVEASFAAFAPACGCPGVVGNPKFVSTRHAGAPTDVEDATITLRTTIEPEGGDMVPPGPVRLVFLLHARAELGWTLVHDGPPTPDTGAASLTFDAQLVEMRRVSP